MSWLLKTGQVLLLTLVATVCMNGGWLNPGASHAAVTWQATGAVAQGTTALTVAWPAHQADDVALLFVETPNVATSLTTPAGFVAVANSPQSTGTANTAGGTRLSVYWARATSAAMASPVLAAVGNHQIAVIVTFRGARATGDPFDATAGSVKTPATVTTTFPTVTTTAANNLIVLAAAVDLPAASTTVFSAFTNAALTGITERFDQSIATGVGGGLGIATGVKATTGATGTSTVTVTSTISTQMTISLIAEPPYAAIASCADCHGFKSPLTFNDNATTRDANTGTFRGSHNLHVQGAGMTCSACHVVPATETATDYKHSNGTVQIAASISGGTYGKASFATANSFSPSTCSNTTCHGTAPSPTWGSNTTNDVCTKCHGTPSASPASVLMQAPTTPAAAAHFKHMSTAYTLKIAKRVTACSECHENVIALNTAGHMNGTKTISYNGPIGTAQSTIPTNTLAGCSTTWCHGGTNYTLIPQNNPARTAPLWGTTFGTTSVLGTGGVAGIQRAQLPAVHVGSLVRYHRIAYPWRGPGR